MIYKEEEEADSITGIMYSEMFKELCRESFYSNEFIVEFKTSGFRKIYDLAKKNKKDILTYREWCNYRVGVEIDYQSIRLMERRVSGEESFYEPFENGFICKEPIWEIEYEDYIKYYKNLNINK